jgi:2-polyprenyl-6-methoxyphenol hydroxylase-like FAD-dependent oxidoreductase
MMLGVQLARAGVDVVVLEKHADFLRDFRGDTIHPSTLEVLGELGFLEAFLKRPHQEVRDLAGRIGGRLYPIADFRHVPGRAKFLAFMPQWDFLDFLAEQGRRYPGFRVIMRAEATELVWDADRVVGVQAQTPDGPLTVRAALVVGADGRSSTVRERAALRVDAFGAPMDVLWFRLPRRDDDPGQTFGIIDQGTLLILIDRDAYYQCGIVIPKGGFDAIRGGGLEAFRARIASIAPFLGNRVDAIASWDDVRLLTVKVDRLRQWYRPGFLCIGDAAHAMSPVGGIGINLAIQDAVAAANRLAEPLRRGRVETEDLRDVQRRRERPTRWTQSLQIAVQNNILTAILRGDRHMDPPLPVRALAKFPILRRIPARVIGVGFRPEHVHTQPVSP